jgi:hypothetical protein
MWNILKLFENFKTLHQMGNFLMHLTSCVTTHKQLVNESLKSRFAMMSPFSNL